MVVGGKAKGLLYNVRKGLILEEILVRKNIKLSCLSALVCILFLQTSYAAIYPFEIFTDNGNFNNDPGVNVWMEVSNGDNIVEFTFYNDSTVQSTVTNIYFDDGTLIGATLSIINGAGTLFAEDGPNNIPGGEEIFFDADREFNVGAEPPPSSNGINHIGIGEWVTIEFELVGGTLENVLNELNLGTLRVGLHIQDFTDGSSESAVNIVPEPATMCLLALGGLILRKRK